MATKTVNTRIKNKVDSLSNWQSYTGTLLSGEIAIVRVETGETYKNPVTGATEPVVELLMKVGDGSSTFAALPWLSAKASDVYNWAKASKVEDVEVSIIKGSDSAATASTLGAWIKALNDATASNAANITANDADITALNGKVDVDKVSTAIAAAINALDYNTSTTDSSTSKIAFVTAVTQTDGKIAVKKRNIIEADLPNISSSKIIVDSTTSKTLATKLADMDSLIEANTAKLAGHTDAQIDTRIDNKINALDVVEPTASGTSTSFIATAKQENGKIVVTKKNLPTASTSTAGIAKLGATGGAATYDSIFGNDGLSADVAQNASDIESLKNSVAGGVHFRGTSKAAPSSGSVEMSDNTTLTAEAGDIVIYSGKEYIYTGSAWEELGDVTRIGALEDKINGLDYDTTNAVATTHKFASQVTQTDGKISVIYTQPTAADVSHGDSTVAVKLGTIDAAIAAKADSGHTHSSYVNQNAFSNIKVGSVTVAADTTTDTVEFVGSNVTITPDATNDKVTFTVADGSTSAKGIVKLSSAVDSTSETLAATPKAVKSAYDKAAAAAADAASRAPGTHAHGNITNDGTLGTASRVVVTDANKKVTVSSSITTTELGYLDGVTSSIQTQLDGKAASSHGTHVTYGGNGSATTVSRSDHSHGTHEARTTAIEGNYVRFANNKLYVGKDGVDEIIFDCGGAE